MVVVITQRNVKFTTKKQMRKNRYYILYAVIRVYFNRYCCYGLIGLGVVVFVLLLF